MKKIIWIIVISVVVVVVAACAVIGLFLDKIVQKGVETVGPKIVQVPLTVDSIHVSLLTGSATVKKFIVGNPDGYKSAYAISVGEASVGVNPFSVFSGKIIAHKIEVKNPEITFEGGLSGNNLSQILDNVNSTAKNGGPTNTTAGGKPKPAKKMEVDDFLITGAKVHGTLNVFGREVTIPSLTIPDIHLTGLGTGSAGITATDLTKRVFEALTSATIKAVAKFGTDMGSNAGDIGKQGINQLKSGIGNLLGK
jgi:hypothetical protein